MVNDKGITEARENLRQAHVARKDAAVRLAQAEKSERRGAEFARAAKIQFEQQAQAVGALNNDLVAAVVHSMRGGEQANLGHAKLDELAAKRASAQARAELAEAAHRELTRDVEAARLALQAAEADVRECAVKLMGAEDDRDADEIERARELVRDLGSRLRADARLPVAKLGTAFAHAAGIANTAEKQTAPGLDPESVHVRRRAAYLESLCQDPDVAYDSIADPGAPAHPLFGTPTRPAIASAA